MEINQEMIGALLALSDEELQKKFRAIASAIGVNERIAAANVSRFRGMLQNTTPDELERLLSALGPSRANEIMKTLNNN